MVVSDEAVTLQFAHHMSKMELVWTKIQIQELVFLMDQNQKERKTSIKPSSHGALAIYHGGLQQQSNRQQTILKKSITSLSKTIHT